MTLEFGKDRISTMVNCQACVRRMPIKAKSAVFIHEWIGEKPIVRVFCKKHAVAYRRGADLGIIAKPAPSSNTGVEIGEKV